MAAVLSVKSGSQDPDFVKYILCKEFGWLPSQIDNEDWFTIEKFLYYYNYKNKLEKSKMERSKSRAKSRPRRRRRR